MLLLTTLLLLLVLLQWWPIQAVLSMLLALGFTCYFISIGTWQGRRRLKCVL